MKKLLLSSLLLFAMALSSSAKGDKEFTKFDTTLGTYEKVYKRGPYLTNKFWDNWFIGAAAGVNVYLGNDDSRGAFGKRLAPVVEISLGKFITPSFGIRAQWTGINAKGWSKTATSYTKSTPNSDNLYKKKFDFHTYHIDMLWNISNSIGGYKNERLWNFVPFLGFGAASSTIGTYRTKWELTIVMGLLNNIRVSKLIDITLEAKYWLFGTELDHDSKGGRMDGATSLTAGLSFKLGPKDGFKRATTSTPTDYTPYKERIASLNGDLGQSNKEIERLKKELEACKNKSEEPKKETRPVIVTPDPISENIMFSIGSSKVGNEGLTAIARAAEAMKKYPQHVYTITGFADNSTGTPAINEALSQKRTAAVAKILMETHGLKESQFKREHKGGVKKHDNPGADRVVTISAE